MKHIQPALVILGATLVLFPACGGGGPGSGGSNGQIDLAQVSNGFGQILPYQVFRLDENGNPTQTSIPILTEGDLIQNVTPLNPILPVTQYPTNAIVPSGLSGNHFMYAQFDRDIDISSVLDPSPGAQSGGGITGAITLVAYEPATNTTSSIPPPSRSAARWNDSSPNPEVRSVQRRVPTTQRS